MISSFCSLPRSSRPSDCLRGALLSLTIFGAPFAAAQTTVPVRPGTPTELAAQAQKLAAQRELVAGAKTALKAGNAEAADQALRQLNKNKPATAAWHIETAQRLVHLAIDSAREGRSDVVPGLAARALQYLAEAEKLARTNRQRASIKSIAGLIHERLLGNAAEAKAAYQAAATFDPAGAQARENLARLEAPEKQTAPLTPTR